MTSHYNINKYGGTALSEYRRLSKVSEKRQYYDITVRFVLCIKVMAI